MRGGFATRPLASRSMMSTPLWPYCLAPEDECAFHHVWDDGDGLSVGEQAAGDFVLRHLHGLCEDGGRVDDRHLGGVLHDRVLRELEVSGCR